MINYEILSTIRKEKGITWGFLESLIGGYRGKFIDYKKGKTTFTEDEELKIANALGTTVAFLSGISKQKNKPVGESDELDDLDIQFLKKIKTLSPERRKLVEIQIDALLAHQQNQDK